MQANPYLFFDGRCEEALDFYRRTLGAEVKELMRFKEMPGGGNGMVTAENANKIMHAVLRLGDASVFVSDGRCLGNPSFQGFALAVTMPSDAESDRTFAALGEGGEVKMPMQKTFFSSRFGSVADRFGVTWMVYTAAA